MEPEAVIPRFIASVDLGGIAAPSRHRGARPVEKTKQALGVPAGNLEQANLVEMRHAKSDNPLRLAQLDCHENLSALESALSALSSQSSDGALLVSPPKHQRCPKTERSPMESRFAREGQSFLRIRPKILQRSLPSRSGWTGKACCGASTARRAGRSCWRPIEPALAMLSLCSFEGRQVPEGSSSARWPCVRAPRRTIP